MIHSSRSLVTLQPARQAALQAIMTVENARQRGARLSAAPHVRNFLRILTGNSRMNTTVAQRIPGSDRPECRCRPKRPARPDPSSERRQ